MSESVIEYWFFLPDVLPVAVHALPPTRVDGAGPVLRLLAQGRLRWLDSSAVPPARVNPFDADSLARVYAVGYGPPPDRDGAGRPRGGGQPAVLAAASLLDGPDGPLLRHLSGGLMSGRDWLVVTVGPDGQVRWQVRALPRWQPPAQWIPVRLELAGLPGSYPGEIVDNTARDGWCLPRFTPDVAAQIVADVAQMPALPPGISRVELGDTPHGGRRADTVGLDEHGYYRVGDGAWPWVSRTLLPVGRLHLFTAPAHTGPTALPAPGQEAFAGADALMWLADGDLVTRTVYSDTDADADQRILHFDGMLLDGIGHIDVEEDPVAPDYRTIDPASAMQLRAVEHLLRLTTPAAARRSTT